MATEAWRALINQQNEESRRYAHRDGAVWTPEEDAKLLQDWVNPGPENRDSARVARELGRTIASCRQRVHEQFGEHLGRVHTKRPDDEAPRRAAWSREDDEEFPAEWYSRG